jgi:hypothetical protein
MKSFVVRVYSDHYLAREEDSPVGTFAVEYGGLEEAIALTPVKTKRPYPKGTRKRRAKAEPVEAQG